MDADEISASLKEFARKRADIVAIYLYGSYAGGTARQDSDIDIAVLFSTSASDALSAELELEGAVGALPGMEQAEVVALNRASLELKAEVLLTGRQIYCSDEEVRTTFEFETIRWWWDLRPWYEAYDRTYFANLKEKFTDEQREAYQRARQTLAAEN